MFQICEKQRFTIPTLILSLIMCMQTLVSFCQFVLMSKMKELECSQDFSHYKSMGIFPDAQGQLTPQSLVRSGRISNLSEMLWMFLLPARMKKIQSKMKALEWSPWTPEFRSDLVQNLMHPFPLPNDLVTIGPLVVVAEILKFENVYGQTDAQTDGRRIDRYTIISST